MKQIYSEVIQFRGNHYDFGYMQGEKIKDSLTVMNRENQWKVRKPRFTIEVEEVKKAITQFVPGVWDELLGYAGCIRMANGTGAARVWRLSIRLCPFGLFDFDRKRLFHSQL